MSYVQETLLENEQVLLETKLSYWAFTKPILAALISIAFSYAAFTNDMITLSIS